MKILLTTFLLFSLSAIASIPTGKYRLDKISCYNSESILKLGGKFMIYTVTLDVTETNMKMTAIAKNGSWAPFKLRCTQVNEGSYSLLSKTQYEGELPFKSAVCNAKTWENILTKRKFGVESFGTFDYKVDGSKLTISNPDTITKYKTCEEVNSYPIYHYTKQ